MSVESCELGAIENIYEEKIAGFKELFGIDDDRDISTKDLELMWEISVREFNARG